MSVLNHEANDAFQPGQLGTRHLLGLMTVAAIILGVSAARLRSLPPLETALVVGDWAIVLAIAGVAFCVGSRRRRTDRTSAGVVWLQALCKPMTERRRAVIKWGLTALVVLDGIYISLFPYMDTIEQQVPKTRAGTWHYVMAALDGMQPQFAIWEGVLWAWCLSHWLTNVYFVRFCEHGIVMYSGFYPWKGMSQLGWSTVHPNRLVFFQRGVILQIPIDPASHGAVNELLVKVRSESLY